MNKPMVPRPTEASYFDLCFLQYRVRLIFKNGKSAEGKLIHADQEHYYLNDATYWISRQVPMLAVPRSKVEIVARLEKTA